MSYKEMCVNSCIKFLQFPFDVKVLAYKTLAFKLKEGQYKSKTTVGLLSYLKCMVQVAKQF